MATDLLIQMLLLGGPADRCEFFAHPRSLKSWKDRLGMMAPAGGKVIRTELGLRSSQELVRGAGTPGVTAWFCPDANILTPLLMRRGLAARLCPVTAAIHGYSALSMRYAFFLRIMLTGTTPCDSIVCSSLACKKGVGAIFEDVAEQFNREHGTRVRYNGRFDVIPLCVDTEKVRPRDKGEARRRLRLDTDSVVLMYLGYISLWKADLFPLIRVFASLVQEYRKRRINLLLVVAGTTGQSYSGKLEDFSRSLGVRDAVRIVENPDEEAKTRLMSAVDVLVSPVDNLEESFGLAPVEAMACGVPQVVANWDGYRETVVDGETGFVVPTYWTSCDGDLAGSAPLLGWEFDHLCLGQSVAVDENALYSSLRRLIDSEPMRRQMGEQSRKRALQNYSFSAVAKRYRQLWLEVADVAQGLQPDCLPPFFHEPHYCRNFAHYPSRFLGSTTTLAITPSGEQALRGGLNDSLVGDSIATEWLDVMVLRRALSELVATRPGARPPGTQGEVVFGPLRDRLALETGCHKDYVARQLMWLIKQGLARPLLPVAMTPTSAQPVEQAVPAALPLEVGSTPRAR